MKECALPGRAAVLLWAAFMIGFSAPVEATAWGGSVRTYVFLQEDLESPDVDDQRYGGLASLRVTGDLPLDDNWRMTVHGVLGFSSPPDSAMRLLTDASAPNFLPLEHELASRRGGDLNAALDRMYVVGRLGRTRLAAGRQAITWGTNYFWPALDLFGPFQPGQIDRDYKPGVDALRVTHPLGDFSEVEAIAAILGGSLSDDRAGGLLARINLGATDIGLMAGRFHGDQVLGGFFTADLAGTGWRAEITRTTADEHGTRPGDRHYWRGSVGIDRMLTPLTSLMLEVAWNGFGARDPSGYTEVAAGDRVRRGELHALGRRHLGVALEWDFHPLWRLGNSLLVNLDDPSSLWVPTLRWSVANDIDAIFGAQLPLGPSPDPDGIPRSEYGLAPWTLFAGLIAYF